MSNTQLHTAISQPRFNRYLNACGSDQGRAEELYKANLLLSQKLYAIIGIFEVVLRNSIDRHFVSLKEKTWLEDAVQPGGYLDNDKCIESFHAVHQAIDALALTYTHDQLITKMTFGFWTYQFAESQFMMAGSTLLQIFPNRPSGTRQKNIFQNLFKINGVRNRIAHYEPICFDKKTGLISTALAQRRYGLIKEMLYWLGCDPPVLLAGIDRVHQPIDWINKIRTGFIYKHPLIDNR